MRRDHLVLLATLYAGVVSGLVACSNDSASARTLPAANASGATTSTRAPRVDQPAEPSPPQSAVIPLVGALR
jgi:hypothetical protein